jgi:hypothetical protein
MAAFGGEAYFDARNGTPALARTPVLPEPTPVGSLSALCGLLEPREAGADPYGAPDNIIAGAGYLCEQHGIPSAFRRGLRRRLRQARSTANRFRSASAQ